MCTSQNGEILCTVLMSVSKPNLLGKVFNVSNSISSENSALHPMTIFSDVVHFRVKIWAKDLFSAEKSAKENFLPVCINTVKENCL